MSRFFYVLLVALLFGLSAQSQGKERILTACKDSFMRSNEQIRNSGGSEYLIVASAPNVRSLVAFDLSGITNTIEKADLRIRMAQSKTEPLSLVIAPMAISKNNLAWGEGKGRLGTKGQNATPGDASYCRSASADVHWETSAGRAVDNLGSAGVWELPIASMDHLAWEKGKWLEVAVGQACLDEAMATESKIVTFGLWGTAGNGIYYMDSKESEHAPMLVLKLKKGEGEE